MNDNTKLEEIKESENQVNNVNEIEKSQHNKEKKGNGKKVILLILFILLFLLVGILSIGIYKLANKDNNYWFDKLAKNGIIEGRTPEEIQAILNTVVEEGMFNIAINPTPTFENGSAQGNIAIENIPANHYYTRVSLVLNETGEKVFQSEGLKPGQYIDYIKLDKKLPKGEYPATARFEITDPETLANIGNVSADITIRILN